MMLVLTIGNSSSRVSGLRCSCDFIKDKLPDPIIDNLFDVCEWACVEINVK